MIHLYHFSDHLLSNVIPILVDALLCLQFHIIIIIIFIFHLSISRQNPRGCGNSQVKTVGSVLFLSLHTHTHLRFSSDFPLYAVLQFLWLRYEFALNVLQVGNCEMQVLKLTS